MLRASEFTCPTATTFDPAVTLFTQDISFNDNFSMMFVFIKASKTDPFRIGVQLRVSALGNSLCPVAAMRQFLYVRGSRVGPLYTFESRIYLSRRYLANLLAQALPSSTDYNTYSFRIGGASAALAAGVSDALIRILGRWNSDCYICYVRVTENTLRDIHHSMLDSNRHALFRMPRLHRMLCTYRIGYVYKCICVSLIDCPTATA